MFRLSAMGGPMMRQRGFMRGARVTFRLAIDTHAGQLMGSRGFTTISKAPLHDELQKELVLGSGRKIKILDEALHPFKMSAEASAAIAEARKKPLPPGALRPGETVKSRAVAKLTSEATRRQCEADPDHVTDPADFPPDGGFVPGSETFGTVDPGDILARFGGERGTYVCRPDVPFEQLGLHASQAGQGLHFYLAKGTIPMLEGEAAPAPKLGSLGGGVQMKVYKPVGDLVAEGLLEEISPPGFDDAEPAGSVTETE